MKTFSKIFIESEVFNEPFTQNLLSRIKNVPVYQIDKVDNYFAKFKKPYLEKRDNLNLFLGKKRGALIKEAPPAYGESKDLHFYFIHAYNCLYECQYCYLQGYFSSPDIVLFTNHHEIGEEIKKLCENLPPNQNAVFHAGEFSDSLALNNLTNEWPIYFDLFKELKNAKLELRTKSTNIENLLALNPISNAIISYSISPQEDSIQYDNHTPSFRARLRSIKKLADHGYQMALHFDPIIYDSGYLTRLDVCAKEIAQTLDPQTLNYISLGVVRFTKEVHKEVVKNYPTSGLLSSGEFIKCADGKVKYPLYFRKAILNHAKEVLVSNGFPSNIIYFCMEDS